jgi:uncharacterized protein YndB with AHSA1/START domain
MSATEFPYIVTRVVDAPVETVWRAWTNPKEYEVWFHAVPGSVDLDVRPGGRWKAVLRVPDGTEHPMTGSYGEVRENERLVTVMDGPDGEPSGDMALDLAAEGGGTRLTLSQVCASEEERAMAEEGSTMLLQWCDEHVSAT